MALSSNAQNCLQVALSDVKAFTEINGYFGADGGFQLHSSGAVYNVSSDFNVINTYSTAEYTWRIEFAPAINKQIQSIKWFSVEGFSPRSPGSSETAEVRITGYNKDSTTGNWYITMQMCEIGSGTLMAPPEGFVVGVKVEFVYSYLLPSGN